MSQYPKIKPADHEEWTSELIDVSGRAGYDAVAPEINQLRQELHSVRTQQARDARSRMMADLDASVPNWREINENPAFLQALEGKDEMGGYKYLDALKAAWHRNDVSVVKAYFEKAAADMNRPRPSSTMPIQRGQDGYLYRSNNAAPQKTMTRSQVAKAYDDLNRGRYKGREAEWKALEAEIVELGRLGRIV